MLLRKIKDKLYYFFAEKNWGVRREYVPYVAAHQEEHAKQPWKHWWILVKLNWHYRVLRRTDILVYEADAMQMPKRHLPYLDGAESELSIRRSTIHLAKDLMQYDIVSFDIFDTLILRPFANPADLFMLVGKRLNRMEFYRIRTDAERRAREDSMLRNGHSEITLYDIYDVIEKRTGIPKELGVQTELQVELDYCFANQYMQQVFRLLQEQGKPIVVVSDMYIPQALMVKLLEKCGYTGYEKLYVSCDYGCSKRSQSLYKYVQRDYEEKSIIHVGDNSISDVQSAQAVGLATYYYKNCHEIGAPYRADGMSELVGSAYAGIVNTHLHSSDKTYSPYYEYGFIYGGLYVLGFCSWIHRRAKQEGIDKILFLSRDGAIYQRVFNMMFDDVPNEYFLWSRIANTKYTLQKNKEDFLKRMVYYRACAPTATTAKSLLDSLSLGRFAKYLSAYGLTLDTLVVKENVKPIEQLFIDHWDEVCCAFSAEKELVKEYIVEKLGSAQKVAIVDVGWLGSGPMGLKYLIENEYALDCKVYCWLAAARSPTHTDIMTELMDDTIESYMFSRFYNRNNFDTHANTNKGLNNIFFEMFTQDVTPSYAGFTECGGFKYDVIEVENYDIVRSIHEGIFDFCKQYYMQFNIDDVMLNVSGYDAYLPYRMIIRDLGFIKNYLSTLSFARTVMGDGNKQKIETVNELLVQAGIS